MPPTPPYTTDRLKVRYVGPFGTHHAVFHRDLASASKASFVAAARAICVAVMPMLWDAASMPSAEYAEAGSGAYFDEASFTLVVGGSGVDPTPSSTPSAFINVTGRGVLAPPKRASLYFFETRYQGDNQMRLESGEDVHADSLLAALTSAATEVGNIAGQGVKWHQYVNLGQNDYITHRARRGG